MDTVFPSAASSRFQPPILAFILLLVCLTGASFLADVLPQCTSDPYPCYVIDTQVLNRQGDAPYRYRILAPALMSLVATPDQNGAWFAAGLVIHLVSFAVIYGALYKRLYDEVGEVKAILGLCIMALMLKFAFNRYYLTPTSIIEVALLCLLFVVSHRFWWVVGLVILASLNRETGVLLVVVYAVIVGRAGVRRFIPLFLLWAGITAALHLLLGAAPHVQGFMGTLQINIRHLGHGLLINLVMLPIWITAVIGCRKSATLAQKRLLWVALLYMVTVFVGGILDESARMALPAIALVLPLTLQAGFPAISG